MTVIEVLSPTNKELNTKGRELYLRKQGEVLKSDVHLVEIDLLRGGEYTLAPPRGKVIERFGDRWHYLMSISRVDDPHNFCIYPRTVRERLPVIPIPLAVGDGRRWMCRRLSTSVMKMGRMRRRWTIASRRLRRRSMPTTRRGSTTC